MSRRTVLRTVLVLLLVAALVALAVRAVARKKAAEAAIPPARSYALVLPTRTAQEGAVRLTLPYLAEVESDTETTIVSKVTARVLMIRPAGSRVRKGESLVRLDAGELQARRKELEARIAQARNEIRARRSELRALQKTHERNRRLLDVQAISRDKFDTEAARIDSLRSTIAALESKIASLRQSIRALQDTLSYLDVRAPADGVVSRTFVTEGGTATAGKPMIELSGGGARRLRVRVPHDLRPRALQWGALSCDLTPLGSTYHGLDEYSCEVQTDVPPGNRVEVRLVVFEGRAVALPPNGLLATDGRHEVLVLENGQGHARPVQVLAEGVEGFAVRGLPPGSEYLVAKPDLLLQAKAGVPVVRTGAH